MPGMLPYQELQTLRSALGDALAKVELLQEQVSIVESLHVNVADQDTPIMQLQGQIKNKGNKQVHGDFSG